MQGSSQQQKKHRIETETLDKKKGICEQGKHKAHCWSLPRWLDGKESTCHYRRCKRCGFHPWVGKIPWRRKWQPTPVFLPGESHGQSGWADYSPQHCKESDTTEHTHMWNFETWFRASWQQEWKGNDDQWQNLTSPKHTSLQWGATFSGHFTVKATLPSRLFIRRSGNTSSTSTWEQMLLLNSRARVQK